MATSQVKQLHLSHGGRPVLVIGRGGRPQWSEVFEFNPRISRTRTLESQLLINGSGVRPYIRAKTEQRWFWKKWNIAPGELYLSYDEKLLAERYRGTVVIEPHTKVAGGNKAWLWERWQQVVDALPELCFTQVGRQGMPLLRGVGFIETTFRQACAVVSTARAFVGTEGGLHHAAAALGVPAVVLYSEFISPEITGYKDHRNIRHAGEACGARLPCTGCRESMLAVTADEVVTNLMEILQ